MVRLDSDTLQADVGPETERVTTLGRLSVNSLVNLERPLSASGRFGGHFVQGHVDAVGCVEDWREDAEFRWLTVSFVLWFSGKPQFLDTPRACGSTWPSTE